MSYTTIAESDSILSHSSAWLGLSDDVKNRHRATATLWLNFSYEWPGCIASCNVEPEGGYQGLPYTLPMTLEPNEAREIARNEWPRVDCCTGGAVLDGDGCKLLGIPYSVKVAECYAALSNLTIPLFGQPTVDSDGGLTKELLKIGPITLEQQWAEPTRGSSGQSVLSDVDALLYKIASRRGVRTGRAVMFM